MRNRPVQSQAYEEAEYLVDPDFLLYAVIQHPGDAWDDPGRVEEIEVGLGYRHPKKGTADIELYQDERSKQLRYEATSLKQVDFKRKRPTGKRAPKRGVAPRVQYRPAMSR